MANCKWDGKEFEPRRSGGLPQQFCSKRHKRAFEMLVRDKGLRELEYLMHAFQMSPAQIMEYDAMCRDAADAIRREIKTCETGAGGTETCESETCESDMSDFE